MNRQLVVEFCRELLDSNRLQEWKIRLSNDIQNSYLGLCSYKDKSILLNAFHIDQHPDIEVLMTIRHEVAHAIVGPGQGHNSIWQSYARALGCDNTLPCSNLTIDDNILNEIHSGAELEVTFDEEDILVSQTIRKPKYTVHKLVDKCIVCKKVAKTKTDVEVRIPSGKYMRVITLECGHVVFKDADSRSPFEDLTFDGLKGCAHQWGKDKLRTTCNKCGARRLYQYQIEGCKLIEKYNGRFAIFDEQGLGKTIQSLTYLNYHKHDAWPFLWVTKSGIKFQHAKEIYRVLGIMPQIIKKTTDFMLPGINAFIISYDLFRRYKDLDIFKNFGIKCVILDECQAISNVDSARSQSVRKVIAEIPKLIPTSGAPWKNCGTEFFVILNALDPSMFNNYAEFERREIGDVLINGKMKKGGLRYPDKFKEKTKHILVRRERKDVMPELPLITRNKLVTEIADHARVVYKQEEDKIFDILKDAILEGTEDSFASNAAIQQSIIVMRQIIGLAKIDAICEFVQEFLEETDRKHVIFIHHKAVAESIFNKMKTWCYDNNEPIPLVLSAALSPEERFAVQEKFNSKSYRLLIASTLASGEGLNLQSCSDCTLGERQWNPANEEQVEGRFIRIGQEASAVTATYVYADKTVDTILDQIVEIKRREFVNSMNKDAYSNNWSEGDITSEVIRQIMGNRKKANAA